GSLDQVPVGVAHHEAGVRERADAPVGLAWQRAREEVAAEHDDVGLDLVERGDAHGHPSSCRRRSRGLVRLVAVAADAGDDRLLRALVQPLAAALDGAQELVEVDLERREDAVGPVLHLEAGLAGLPPRLVDDLLRLALGKLDDLGLRGLARGLLSRLAEDAVALPLRLGEHLLELLDDPAGLLDLLRDRRPHLVEDVVDLLAVDANLVGQRHGLRVVHEVVELVDQYENVHISSVYSCGLVGAPPRPSGNSSRNLAATAGGTSSSTFPPKAAISFTPLEEMNE